MSFHAVLFKTQTGFRSTRVSVVALSVVTLRFFSCDFLGHYHYIKK